MNALRSHARVVAGAAAALCLVGLPACGSSKQKAAGSTTTVAASSSATTVASGVTTAAGSGTGTTVAGSGTADRGLSGLVTDVVGNGRDDGSGVPGPALSASIGSRAQFAVAPGGDLYLSSGDLRVLRVSGGKVTVFGTLDPSRGPGAGGIAVGPDGSVYVATSQTVVRFSPEGKRSTIASTSSGGLTSSLGPIAVDGAGNVFVGDGSRRIWELPAKGGRKVVAGTGAQAKPDSAEGDGGPATKAPLGAPSAFAFDGKGDLLFADQYSHRIRKIDAKGVISTIAGGGTTRLNSQTGTYADDGVKATDLLFADVSGLAVDTHGRVYVADSQSEAIIRFEPGGGLELLAGSQKHGSEQPGLPANRTRVTVVTTIGFDSNGNLYFLEGLKVHAIADAAAP